jgi:predicted xylose isomerase-like sugar epimerase
MADEPTDALRKLEDRVEKASDEAQRLIDEARAKPPPAGWQSPGQDGSREAVGSELDALISAVRSLRDLVPPEVMQRLAEALKEVLVAIRSLIDYYVERLDRPRKEPPEIKDIPIS